MIYSFVGDSPWQRQLSLPQLRTVLPLTDGALHFLLWIAVGWVAFVAMVSLFRPRPIGALWRAGALALIAQWLLNWYVGGGHPATPLAMALIPLSGGACVPAGTTELRWRLANAVAALPISKRPCLTPLLLWSVSACSRSPLSP